MAFSRSPMKYAQLSRLGAPRTHSIDIKGWAIALLSTRGFTYSEQKSRRFKGKIIIVPFHRPENKSEPINPLFLLELIGFQMHTSGTRKNNLIEYRSATFFVVCSCVLLLTMLLFLSENTCLCWLAAFHLTVFNTFLSYNHGVTC